ncbi:N-acetylhexosaminidase [Planoprotostelium fungivorum]|uniref:Beta-hexosaminidase n=1 Tax=Planoprotostelium fungivorum TaxID=1890364 RepID=A0A2P6NXG7_9EUKA|nr:N-acetylhexosaminidase [Planoprotostelium fungivorum]
MSVAKFRENSEGSQSVKYDKRVGAYSQHKPQKSKHETEDMRCLIFSLLIFQLVAGHLNVWPIPKSYTMGDQSVIVDSRLKFKTSTESTLLFRIVNRYSDLIRKTSWTPEFRNDQTSKSSNTTIRLVIISVDHPDEPLGPKTDESYVLDVPANSAQPANGNIQITAHTTFGALRALETLKQLVELEADGKKVIHFAPLHIEDAPAFSHRGLLLDTSRNYFPVKDILRTLDGMSMNKLNVFHWHIVDSQSFPLESKALPELSAKGAYKKKGKSLVYTKSDIQDIVQYGIERGIRVIPEFDMPGHTRSIAWSHPELITCVGSDWTKTAAEPPAGQLDPTNPATYSLIQTLFNDVVPWFSDSYWHAGGDEVNIACWNSSESIRNWMSQNNEKDWNKLVQTFVGKVYGMLDHLKRTPMLWEEMVLDFDVTAPAGSVVQVWRGVDAISKVTAKGYHTVVSSSDYLYIDCGHGNFVFGGNSWCDPFKTWQMIYNFNPLTNLTAEQSALVLGGEVALWTEQTDTNNLDPTVWPRTASAAENFWSGRRDGKGQERTTREAFPRLWDQRVRLVEAGIRAAPLQPLYCAENSCFE